MSFSHSVMSDWLWPHGHSPPGSSVYGVLQARILELSSHSLFQRIFLTQGFLYCRQILYHLSYQGSHCSTEQMITPWNSRRIMPLFRSRHMKTRSLQLVCSNVTKYSLIHLRMNLSALSGDRHMWFLQYKLWLSNIITEVYH